MATFTPLTKALKKIIIKPIFNDNLFINMKAKLEFTYYPNPILRQKCAPILDFNDEIKSIAAEMLDKMHEHRGIGLAGPQVGLNQRIIVIEPEPGTVKVLINPEITAASKDWQIGEEGCLSFPQIYGLVPRSKNITVRYQDIDGKKHKIKATKMLATVLAHEIDHLNQILFIDRFIKVTQNEASLKKLLKESKEKINLYE
jgi:peptide deformylase